MKQITAIILSLIIGLSLSGCAGNQSIEGLIRPGFTPQELLEYRHDRHYQTDKSVSEIALCVDMKNSERFATERQDEGVNKAFVIMRSTPDSETAYAVVKIFEQDGYVKIQSFVSPLLIFNDPETLSDDMILKCIRP